MEAIAFLSGFSPLLIGEIGATFQVRLQYVCGRLVSVPSSSGRSVRLAKWFENGTPLTSRFSPLLIGEIGATIYFGPRDERISQVSVPSSSGRSVRLQIGRRKVIGAIRFSPLLIGEIGATSQQGMAVHIRQKSFSPLLIGEIGATDNQRASESQ